MMGKKGRKSDGKGKEGKYEGEKKKKKESNKG